MKRFSVLLALLAIVLPAQAQLSVSALRTCGLENPQGIDPSEGATLSWILTDSKRDSRQSAYEVTLKSGSRTVWRSGKVESSNSVRVKVPEALSPAKSYSWTVRVWDNHGQVSQPATASFSTGLDAASWKAGWIGTAWEDEHQAHSPIYLRKSIKLSSKPLRAVAYVSSHGIYELSLGGRKVGSDYFTPGWTSYHNTIQYQAYDITSMLKPGANELTALVSPGWYASGLGWGEPDRRLRYGTDLALCCQIELEYSGGRKETVVTDESWEMSLTGPVCEATIYDGETIDQSVPFSWEPARTVPSGSGRLVASACEPVRVRTVVKPVACITTPKGEKVLDFGQNARAR